VVTDFENVQADGIQKLPIMGDRQNGTAVFGEVALEPPQGFEVEMVGRFIKHQEIRLHDQEAGQMGPHDPAAAEGACGFGDIALTEGEAAQDALCLDRQSMPIEFGKTGNGLVVNSILFTRMFA